MSQLKKILVSVPDTLLEEVDLLADSQNINRSEFIREAMKLYVRERKRVELSARMKKGYEEMAEINLAYANFCFEADSLQQQNYEEKLAECE